jgi:uncharacterized membrane protein
MTRARVIHGLLLVLSFAGFLISFYLTLNHYRNTVPPCYVVTGCESVVTSRYSTIAGIPVALLGAIFFGGMFYLTIALATVRHRWVKRAYDVLSMVGALGAILLFLIQAVILEAYCSYCLTTEIVALSMWGLGLFLPSVPAPVAGSTADIEEPVGVDEVAASSATVSASTPPTRPVRASRRASTRRGRRRS